MVTTPSSHTTFEVRIVGEGSSKYSSSLAWFCFSSFLLAFGAVSFSGSPIHNPSVLSSFFNTLTFGLTCYLKCIPATTLVLIEVGAVTV